MNRRNQLNQRHPHASPSQVLQPPSGPSSGRSSPAPYGSSHSNANSDFKPLNKGYSGAGPSSHTGPGAGFGYARPSSAASQSQSQYSESPYGGGMASAGGRSAAAMHVEGQNDEMLDSLLGKVKILKDITVGIGDEVRASNMELGGMNDAFASTSNFLNGTFRRMTKMAKRQGGTWCYFLGFVLFCLWLFVIVWWLRR